jgi:hypothetical protein
MEQSSLSLSKGVELPRVGTIRRAGPCFMSISHQKSIRNNCPQSILISRSPLIHNSVRLFLGELAQNIHFRAEGSCSMPPDAFCGHFSFYSSIDQLLLKFRCNIEMLSSCLECLVADRPLGCAGKWIDNRAEQMNFKWRLFIGHLR